MYDIDMACLRSISFGTRCFKVYCQYELRKTRPLLCCELNPSDAIFSSQKRKQHPAVYDSVCNYSNVCSSIRDTVLNGDKLFISNFGVNTLSIRGMAKKKMPKNSQRDEHESDSDDSDDEEEDEEVFPEETDVPLNYRQMMLTVPSVRADKMAAKCLNISGKQIEKSFYGGCLRFNGNKLLKKHKKLEIGDYVDLAETAGSEKVKRVKLMKIKGTTRNDNVHVIVRAWRAPFTVG